MDKLTLKEKVYKILRNDILTGQISGGTHITESMISKRLDVSRTPVREALQRLTQEKLVVPLPRAGYMIEDMSDDDIQDLFSARFDIEVLAVKKAVQYITVDELRSMEENIEKTRTHILSGELQRVTELDLEFHGIIYKASRSKTFYRICKNLGDLTMKYRHGLNLVKDLWEEAIENHTAIYLAICAKDEERAIRAITRHGEQAKYQLLDIMKKVRSDSFFKDEI
ncbi:transcriptional regulator (GntR family protein) [Desulforapulum autotrophicum HRM2]|jgi:DNA-binding GntR family transcriptional regulator|uniref:Transcriptional regulator (GntR family protein) n=1 Tax=Desulforapulum autotrophicum (strain ATCC 43914 / DSM 3382 / VKM B-1955 / HRM2) TaxID=177437 RepID=C0QME0_DESAH|nr:GntR family transcriptional regulator [Desulforapulum autotrophicum]ACN16457.1 transcriptional regulator (GntR family protein) [Desulforapulum autotrophicum HRM2]